MIDEVGIKRAIINGVEATSFLDPGRPFADESLLGFFARVADDHLFRKMVHALKKPAINTLYPEGLPFHHHDAEERLAFVFKVPKLEIARRMYRPTEHGGIDFFGAQIRKGRHEPRRRRVSPRALNIAPYYRAIWDIRILNFCPDTKENLLDSCPVCERQLGWRHTYGIVYCDRCSNQRKRPTVDLREFPQKLIEIEDITALDFVCDLIHPLEERKSKARSALSDPFIEFSNSELFEFAVALASAETTSVAVQNSVLERPKSTIEYERYTPNVIARAGRAILDWPRGFDAIASKVRDKAPQRRAFYGVAKELGPLTAICRERIVANGLKDLVRLAIEENMLGTENMVRRPTYRSAELITVVDASHEYHIHRSKLDKLAASGAVKTLSAQGTKRLSVLFDRSELDALMKVRASVECERSVAARLGVPAGSLPEFASQCLIKEVSGPVVQLFGGRRCFDKITVDKLIASIEVMIAPEPASKTAVRIPNAVNRTGVSGPKPWSSIFKAILDRKLSVRRMRCERVGLMRNLAVDDNASITNFVEKRHSSSENFQAIEYVTFRDAADLLGSSEIMVSALVTARELPARRGVHWKIKQADVLKFICEKMLSAEIAAKLGIGFRAVHSRLTAIGIEPVATVMKDRGYVWCRAEVENNLLRLRYEPLSSRRRRAA